MGELSIALDAVRTHPSLQNRNIGMQKYKEDSDAKRYKDHIKQLSRSIKADGQQEPIKVVAAEEGGRWEFALGADQSHFIPAQYWLVDGHHRIEALQRMGATEVRAELLPGRGFDDAFDASRLSNQQVIQSLSTLERTENAWSAFNQERDTFRKLPIEEAAERLTVSTTTIKRFRDAVRQEGVRAGKIEPEAPRDKKEQQLQAYWNRKGTWKRLSVITWGMFRESRKEPSKRTSGAARKRIIKMATIQTLFGEHGRYDLKDVVEALKELGEEAKRPDAAAYLEDKYKPKVHQPTDTDDDEEDTGNVVAHHQQRHKRVPRMHAHVESEDY